MRLKTVRMFSIIFSYIKVKRVSSYAYLVDSTTVEVVLKLEHKTQSK